MMTIAPGFVSGDLGDDSGTSTNGAGGDGSGEAKTNDKENCKYEADVSRHGHEIHPAKDASTREECCKICTNMIEPVQCMSWSFNKHTGVCYPQSLDDSSENSRLPDLCCDSGVIRSSDIFSASQQGEAGGTEDLAREEAEEDGGSGSGSSGTQLMVVLLAMAGLASMFMKKMDDDDDDEEGEGTGEAGAWEKETSDRVDMEMQARRNKAAGGVGGEGVRSSSSQEAAVETATPATEEEGDIEFEI